ARTGETLIDLDSYRDVVGVDFSGVTRFTVSETHFFCTTMMTNRFFAVNRENGKVEWAYDPGKRLRADDQPYIANGRIYFRSLSGLYVFEGPDGFLPEAA
ncbi:MAG: hypothetical protein SXV54_03250, partial [Chloroflexota bacterium]|nr:hypothetical protein [Chloroflexota bacterium]